MLYRESLCLIKVIHSGTVMFYFYTRLVSLGGGRKIEENIFASEFIKNTYLVLLGALFYDKTILKTCLQATILKLFFLQLAHSPGFHLWAK